MPQSLKEKNKKRKTSVKPVKVVRPKKTVAKKFATKRRAVKAKKLIIAPDLSNKKELLKIDLPQETQATVNVISETVLNIETKTVKNSPHIVNLKNPLQQIFENENLAKISTSINRPQPLPVQSTIKPPKTLPKKFKTIGVNFTSVKAEFNFLDWLGLTSLFQVIVSPFKQSTAKKTSNLKLREETTKILSLAEEVDLFNEEIEDVFAAPTHQRLFNFYIPRDWHKKLATFVLVSIILVLPLQAFTYYQDLNNTKDRILLATNDAIENLKMGQQAAVNFDLNGANDQFNQAKINFTSAQKEINDLNLLTSEILKLLPSLNKTVNAGMTLLEAGQTVAETGEILANSGKNLFNNKGDVKSYYQSLIFLDTNLKLAIDKFNTARIKIAKIKPNDLPAQNRQAFEKVLNYIPEISQGLNDVYTMNKALLKALGQNQWQRYLVIFLNNNELRGGGGFMGSFALVDVDKGQIKKIEIPAGGTYDLQGALVPKVAAPEPLQLLKYRWEFQDANWWPDFPTTAKKTEWFYQNAKGPSVDGVIMLTSTLMERLLDVFGPIPMPEYGRDITSQNFVAETQKIVQLEYDKKENRPKQFIADMAPKLLDKIFSANKDQLSKLLITLKESLNQRQLLVYFNDQKIEDIVNECGWSGRLRETDGDYLSVVHTNLAGGKTDAVIKETIEHQAEIQSDGSIIDTVKLVRRHNGKPDGNIFTGVQNNSYVRFYVPLGSTLLDAKGFKKPDDKYFSKPDPAMETDIDLISIETDHNKDVKTGTDIYKESGKTVFGNWLQLKPGEVQETIIKYRLPFSMVLAGQNTFYYSLLAQKQAGSLGSELKSFLKLNDSLKPLAKFPANLSSDDTGVSFHDTLVTDKFYGAVLVNK
ncbi:MAG: DUF4012 domain-containing protein [Patescibacteria group bacterium]